MFTNLMNFDQCLLDGAVVKINILAHFFRDTVYISTRGVNFVFFQIRTSFVKFEFYSNFV